MVYHSAMIRRDTDVNLVRGALKRSRVVAILGPRQCTEIGRNIDWQEYKRAGIGKSKQVAYRSA
jgi:hypothetical protein